MFRVLKNFFLVLYYSFRDFLRFTQRSGVLFINEKKIEGHIIAVNHTIEKGLAMPDQKTPFSIDRVEYLIFLLKKFGSFAGKDNNLSKIMDISVKILKDWSQLHHTTKDVKIQKLIEEISRLSTSYEKETIINFGLIKEAYLPNETFSKMASRRRSIRNYDETIISENIIDDACKVASFSPSVCNRNLGGFELIKGNTNIKKALDLQGGNRGYDHKVFNLGYIFFKINRLYDPEERNQGFIDAGLFAMTLTYALLSKGIGSVMLNWAQSPSTDLKFRRLLKIPKDREIVSLLAFVIPT